MPRLQITDELRIVCRSIVNDARTTDEWAASESDDEFQTEHLCGGFDAEERSFLFSWFAADDEWWFSLTPEQASEIADGADVAIELRHPQLPISRAFADHPWIRGSAL